MASRRRSIPLPVPPSPRPVRHRENLRASYRALEGWWQSISPHPGAGLAAGGYQGGWWPARSPLEIMVTAILVQNTRWENVARAVGLLHEAGLLPVDDSVAGQAAAIGALHALGVEGLEPLLHPAGCARIKSRRVHNLLALLVRAVDGDISRLAGISTEALCLQLLAVAGIGPETADAILLYALGRPAFPVDAYLRRVLERHGWATPRDSYDALRDGINAALSGDVEALHRYHALVVEVAKRHCGRVADCVECPLRHMLDL